MTSAGETSVHTNVFEHIYNIPNHRLLSFYFMEQCLVVSASLLRSQVFSPPILVPNALHNIVITGLL